MSNESKHTPGPWIVKSANDGRKNVGIESAEVVPMDAPHKLVATLYITAWKVDRRDARPNARLIAAAPDLLEALKIAEAHIAELREAWERGVFEEHDAQGGTRSNRNIDVHLAIQRALAKAEVSA